MGSATCAHDDRFGPEDVQITGAYIKTDSTADPVVLAFVHQQVRDHDAVIDLVGRFSGRLGDNRFVAFAVDHDLPFAFPLVTAVLGVAHERKTPFFEFVHRRINVPGHVVGEILPNYPHQVIARIAHMILGLVLIPLHTHIAVDGVKALCNRATAVDVGFFGHDDLHIAAPVTCFIGGTRAAHAPADNQNVAIFKNRLEAHQ